ncbi:MAG: tetratricopeptide repeat protein [Arenimonas sp.]
MPEPALDNIDSDDTAAQFRAALALHKQGRLAAAADAYRQVLSRDHQHADALHLLGVVEQQSGLPAAAIELIARAIALRPGNAAMHSNLGIAQHRLGRQEQALASFRTALALQPGYLEAWSNLGLTLQSLGRHEEALPAFDQALQLRPSLVEAELRRGHSLRALNRHAQALASHERVLQASPDHFEALVARGNALQRLSRHAEALQCYDRALAIQPARGELHNNRGSALRGLKRYSEAAEAFERLLAAKPDFDYAASNLLHSRLYACDWRDHEAQVAALRKRVLAGERADVPFSFLAVSDSADEQLACARRYVLDHFPPAASPMFQGQPRREGRLRVAYLSADFHEHATAHLLAGVFERHDRTWLETIAVSFGPDADDAMRGRLRQSFDQFIDVRHLGDFEAASLLRELDVDLAIDLKGFTVGNRAGILAHRPARLQVSYLGYPGSMGAPYIDYVIADERVLPASMAKSFDERIAWLPGSYQANDADRRIAARTPTRAEAGLPERGFVFCCFNNNYKFNPETWAAWMRLLRKLPTGVLWLIEDNPDAVRNLRAEANFAGVAPERLVFAPRLPLDQHLARHRLADLFLDTLPCNAHTTASDALWAGLPVLTCTGHAFAGRVAASLLHALGLDELACPDLAAWEATASRLAADPERLLAVRRKLAQARDSAPLFDTARSCLDLESAYREMWRRFQAGEPPASFRVEPHP